MAPTPDTRTLDPEALRQQASHHGDYCFVSLLAKDLRALLDHLEKAEKALKPFANCLIDGRVDLSRLDHDDFLTAACTLTPPRDEWDALKGSAPNATGDMSSEAFVRQSRDEWPDHPRALTPSAADTGKEER